MFYHDFPRTSVKCVNPRTYPEWVHVPRAHSECATRVRTRSAYPKVRKPSAHPNCTPTRNPRNYIIKSHI